MGERDLVCPGCHLMWPPGSGLTETGMARLALSDDDARVRGWLAHEARALGCQLTVDQMGNMFVRRPGFLSSSAPMTAMSSHLDSQPFAGRYDGILGVMAAVEVLRTLGESDAETRYDLGLVNWTKCAQAPPLDAQPRS